ncbi:FHA domain-containing protein [Phaeodactylibacter xiamenensis]|jgi:pSer/pThr/pTyr-binding forkhead associated (FHA) protein|uniref:FHA domain-containing protein n=1 Tax=Phaeodactylibacter xiamenensis TaxID=1524460 RepID=UPI0024A7C847|nr:FHA domain-containing protein [Phaeodactylibacter xiamenensis]
MQPNNMPVIKCKTCQASFRIPEALTSQVACPHCRTPYYPEGASEGQTLPKPPGWLIVHDEQTHHQILELRKGINTIGRKAGTSKASAQIDFGSRPVDKFMSRVHCEINALPKPKGAGFDLIIKDLSTNGTVLNARKDQKLVKGIDEIYLKHEDVIQLGRTKLVVILGTHTDSIKQTAEDIARTSYHETIIDFNY